MRILEAETANAVVCLSRGIYVSVCSDFSTESESEGSDPDLNTNTHRTKKVCTLTDSPHWHCMMANTCN